MKNAFAIVTLAGLLTACAGPLRQAAPTSIATAEPVPAPPAEAQPQAAEAQAQARTKTRTPVLIQPDQPAVAEEEPAPDEHLPNVKLTSDLLYKLMKAEMEFGQGNWQSAYITMMSTAQQTRDPRLAKRATEMALMAKQGEQTLAALRLWRELAPDSEEATQYYLGFVVLSDNLTEAEAVFRKRLADAPPAARGMAMFQMQQLLVRAKDKAAAAAMIERLVAPYAGTMEAHVVLAQSALAAGAAERALTEARKALALKPDSEIAALTLAQVSDGEAAAESVLAQFLAANPQAREVRTARARLLVNRKQYEQARQEFLTLLKGQPDNLGTLYALGVISLQMNDPAGAERHFIRFTEVMAAKPDPEHDASKVLMILAQLAEERGDLKGALAWLDKVEDGEAWFGAQLKRAQLIGKQGDIAGARKLLAGLNPGQASEQAQVVLAEGQVLRDAGQQEAAFALLKNGVEKFPANPDLLYDFALLAEKTGRLDIMEKSLRQVMLEAPDNHHAYNALGYSLAERNVRLQEALELIDKAMKMAPGDPFIMDSMGWVQYRLGNLNAAEAALRQAYALRSDPEIAVHLGEVLWQKGQKADAQKLWREARAKDPKNDTLRNTLARLHLSL